MPIATRDGAGGGRTPARDAILDAARSLFAAHGIRGTTVRAIAKSSGLSNTLLYYYFPHKDDLLEALLEPPEMAPVPTPEVWTPQACADVIDYLETVFFTWTDPGDFLRMLIIECYAGNERCIGVSTAELNLYVDALEPMLSVACSRQEARERALSLGYSLSGLLWQAVMHHGKQFQERLASPEGRDRVRTTIKLHLPLPRTGDGGCVTRESHFSGDDIPPRERILNAAMHLFADRGYSATPIKAIARACDMSDAGVFHHFATKRDILEALLDRPHKRMEAHVTDEPVRDFETLDRLVLRTLDSAHVNEPILRVLIRQQLVGDPEALAARDMALNSWRDALRFWFAPYRPEDIDDLVESFINSLMGWLFIMQIRHGSAIVDRFVDPAFRAEACAQVRRSVPLDRFALRTRKAHRTENEGIS